MLAKSVDLGLCRLLGEYQEGSLLHVSVYFTHRTVSNIAVTEVFRIFHRILGIGGRLKHTVS